MKHLSIAVILFLSVIGSTKANPITGTDELKFMGAENFRHEFPQATGVNYKVKGQYTEVSFIWNGLELQAFYDMEGNPMATTRTINKDNLPLGVQLAVKKQYSEGVVTNVIEYTNVGEGLSYYLTLASPKATYVLHVSTGGEISVFKKMKH